MEVCFALGMYVVKEVCLCFGHVRGHGGVRVYCMEVCLCSGMYSVKEVCPAHVPLHALLTQCCLPTGLQLVP